jgi:hypothetical protein
VLVHKRRSYATQETASRSCQLCYATALGPNMFRPSLPRATAKTSLRYTSIVFGADLRFYMLLHTGSSSGIKGRMPLTLTLYLEHTIPASAVSERRYAILIP